MLFLTACSTTKKPFTRVTYVVESTDSVVEISYSDQTGEEEKIIARPPFEYSLLANDQTKLFIMANTILDNESITCKIIIQDKVAVENTVDRNYLHAICGARLNFEPIYITATPK